MDITLCLQVNMAIVFVQNYKIIIMFFYTLDKIFITI